MHQKVHNTCKHNPHLEKVRNGIVIHAQAGMAHEEQILFHPFSKLAASVSPETLMYDESMFH